MKEKFGMKGVLHYVLKDEHGNIKDEKKIPNLITNLMDAHVAQVMSSGTDSAQARFMAIGSGVGGGPGSTDLSNFVDIIALSGTGSPTAGTGANDNDVVYSAYWGAGVGTNDNIREAGVFRTSGTVRDTLLTYNSGLSINKGASDTLKIDWTVTFGAS